jgi:hypothetical protein
LSAAEHKIASRQIVYKDLDVLADFLGQGLGYPPSYYRAVLRRLEKHRTPPGFPRFGYVLTDNSVIVGAIVQIYSNVAGEHGAAVRCHMASWCVGEAHRPYAALFFRKDLTNPDVTYINTSARPVAIPVIRAQGFGEYSSGQFLSVPLLSSRGSRVKERVRVLEAHVVPDVPFDTTTRQLLVDHADFGCIAFWISTKEAAYPFVFQQRLFKGFLPGAQVIYCRHVDDLSRFAQPLGRFLARKGLFLMRVDANGRLPGLPGWYFDRMEPRYCKGAAPRLGDLAYTQSVLTKYRRRPFSMGG